MRCLMVGISVAVLLLASLCACAHTWHVPDDVPTIQEGLNVACPGETVLVACGTYYEHDISWTRSGITLRSETGEPDCVTVDAQGLGRVFYINTGMSSSVRMEGFTITGGSAPGSYGGGMYWYCSDPYSWIANCVFTDNDASFGGGVAVRTCSPQFRHCWFRDNTADYDGGGVYVLYGSPGLWYCTMSGNSAGRDGGAMHLDPVSNAGLVYSTLFGNSAGSGRGGGVRIQGCSYPMIRQAIIAFSTQGDAVSWDQGGALTIDHCCVYGNAGGDSLPGYHHDNIFEDPLFCDAENEDFTLHADSPCLPANNPWDILIGRYDLGCGLALEATVDFDPNTLNCRSHHGSATSYIELPDGYDPADIDVATVLLNDALPALSLPTVLGDHDLDGIPDRMVKFDRGGVIGLLPLGQKVEVLVSGELTDGTAFAGADSIRVICKRRPIDVSTVPDPNLRVSSTPGVSSATVSYELGAAGPASLRVYDVSGRLVRTLVAGTQASGHHEIAWDGRSDEGRSVGAGVYFIRLERQGEVSVAKTIVLR